MTKSIYSLEQLLQLMRCLRDDKYGCPWDLKQSLDTIIPHTLDEVYEVIDAIQRNDKAHLKDELGDLLFQVVFYAQLCSEKPTGIENDIQQDDERFDFHGVVDGVTRKLLRRHPHVFPDGTLDSFGQPVALSDEDIKANWERIKAEERAEKPQGAKEPSALDDIPTAAPALMRAHKLQKRAATQGFDWQTLKPVLENLEAEIVELKEAIAENSPENINDEFGDVLFSCVNLARHLKLDSEQSLRDANQKFENRFRQVEFLAKAQRLDMKEASEAQLDQLWQEAKQRLKASN